MADPTTLWSHSRLQVASCPRRFHAVYEEGLEEPTSPEALRGQQVHEAVETYTRHLIEQRREQDRTFAADLARACDSSEVAELVHRLPDVVEVENLYADAAGVEREFDFPLSTGDHIRGRFDQANYDAANATAVVVEYKSFPCWDHPDRCPDQLMIYACAARCLFPEAEVVEVHRKHIPNGFVCSWEFDAAGLSWAWLEEWIGRVKRQLAEAKQRGKWPACPGSWCEYCGLAATCYEDLSEATVRLAAERLRAAEVAVKRLRKTVQTYTKDNGPVVVGDLQAGYFPPQYEAKGQHHYSVKSGSEQAAREALRKRGEDPDKYLKLVWKQDEEKLGRLVRKGATELSDGFAEILATEGELAASDELADILERVEPKPTFTFRKLGGEDEEAEQPGGEV
ncbi:MAG: PD-(D/E)XK nuclease family protein [Armatimonadota bacterium]